MACIDTSISSFPRRRESSVLSARTTKSLDPRLRGDDEQGQNFAVGAFK